jgi:transketolase
VENQNGWHGKALEEGDLKKALDEMGEIDLSVRGEIRKPDDMKPKETVKKKINDPSYNMGDAVPTRNAYGNALKRIYPLFPEIVSLDGEVSNSTRAEYFHKEYPDRFFEMFIAEQNMVGAAQGMACRGKLPFVSSFGAFMSRAFDQIRMGQYSDLNIKYVGSHAGVSIGQDGPSQMALEDLAMFRSILNSVVLYPSDAVSTEKLVEEAAKHKGMVYIRITRGGTPVIYGANENFPIGGSKILKKSDEDVGSVIAAGITLHEALKAYDILKKENISVRIIDLYSIKPLDEKTIAAAAKQTRFLITVEDHYPAGGLGEAVKSTLTGFSTPVYSLSVTKKPRSGKPSELMDYENISGSSIASLVKEKLGNS